MYKALFLDRDGVVNVEKDYLYKIDDFEFINGIFELCKFFQEKNYKIVIVTNQSGIARGFYSEDDFNHLSHWMTKQFQTNGIEITAIYHCPHHEKYSIKCQCRKPEPGMLLQAAQEYNIDLVNSIIVGDKERDIEAGLNAGLHLTYLFDETGTTKTSKATKIVSNLKEIIDVNS